ncbi:MAG: LysM peptidoglycan-binding domain-containing protein [Butyrivibrio sp.]|nr:LysM peptidoglycan-binding domain-containing protein [Butyrivibrio sp.]
MNRKLLSFCMALVLTATLAVPTRMVTKAEVDDTESAVSENVISENSGSTYIVKKGDYLEKIAKEQLGDSKRWKEIYELNKDQIKNPSMIREGMELKLSADGEDAEVKEDAAEEKAEKTEEAKDDKKDEKVEESEEEKKDEKAEEAKDDKEEKDEKAEEAKEEKKDEKAEEAKDDKEEKDEKVEESKEEKKDEKAEEAKEEKKDEKAEESKEEDKEEAEAAEEESEEDKEESAEAELQYWAEDSPVAAAIVEYVKDVTDEDSANYIPVEDRIAVFDMDGTLIGELYPSYFEYMLFIHRALYDENYKAPADMKEFAQALEKGIYDGKLPEGNELKHANFAGAAYAGMTPQELKDYAKEFMKSEADGFTNLTRGEAFYKPMVSLVEYLDEHDFQCYIVSGSDRTVCRAIIKDTLPIPENRVIGMSYTMVASGQGDTDGLEYVYSEDDDVILGGELIIKTIKMNKVSAIEQEIGKVPVLSFGNSSGDVSMAQYVVNNDMYESRAFMVLCDDLEREHGNMDKADSMKKTCLERGFMPISMKDDFGTIYGDGVEAVPYGEEEAEEDAAG